MAGVVHIPWYATGFRGEELEAGLVEVASAAMRYGATSYHLYRSRDDRYKFVQMAAFDSKLDFERYWNGPECIDFRVLHSSHYQVPVVYAWHDELAADAVAPAAESAPAEPSAETSAA